MTWATLSELRVRAATRVGWGQVKYRMTVKYQMPLFRFRSVMFDLSLVSRLPRFSSGTLPVRRDRSTEHGDRSTNRIWTTNRKGQQTERDRSWDRRRDRSQADQRLRRSSQRPWKPVLGQTAYWVLPTDGTDLSVNAACDKPRAKAGCGKSARPV